jgi:very-short-patch-repair endonuclease
MRRLITPANDKFNSGRYRGFDRGICKEESRSNNRPLHGPVKVIYSRDPHPVVDPPTWLGMRAGELRLRAPKCERIVRDALKRFEKHGYHFHHSVAMFGFIADFACLEKPFIVEIDGKQHNRNARKAKDKGRDEVFRLNGYTTLRFWSSKAYRDLESIMRRVAEELGVTYEPPEQSAAQ